MTSVETIARLCAPLEYTHGFHEIASRLMDGMAILIKQNETIISELQVLTAPSEKTK